MNLKPRQTPLFKEKVPLKKTMNKLVFALNEQVVQFVRTIVQNFTQLRLMYGVTPVKRALQKISNLPRKVL